MAEQQPIDLILMPEAFRRLALIPPEESLRFPGTRGVRYQRMEDGTVRLEATDGRVVARITLEKDAVVATSKPGEFENRFPQIEQVIPAGTPLCAITVDPRLLIRALEIAEACGNEWTIGVSLEIHKATESSPGENIVIRAKSESGECLAILKALVRTK